MAFLELDYELDEEGRMIRQQAREFFMNVWRPASIKLDKLANPDDVITPDSIFWDVLRQSYKLGYHKMGYPKEYGGLELPPLTRAIINEEMGYASADFAISLGCCGYPFAYARMSQNPQLQELVRKYCDDTEAKYMGCWAITEPEHGSDWLITSSEFSNDPKCVPQVRAKLVGDKYIVNGQKSSWVSNGTVASHALLFLNLDPSKGSDGNGIAIIPLNLPGITRGKPLNKLGQRALNQGEIFFDNVPVPKEWFISTDTFTYRWLSETNLAWANAGMGNIFTGVAEAALDEAIAYAKQRVQGGKPIIEHQSVKARLFDMYTQVEAAKALSRRVAVNNTKAPAPSLQNSTASKIFCTETAFRVASMAVQIFGGYGLSKDFVIEKIFRDARASMIEDGVNETLALGAADKLK